VDGRGIPLSIAVTGANRHDVTQTETVLEAVTGTQARPSKRRSNPLCADAAYTGRAAEKIMVSYGSIPHVRGRGEEAQFLKDNPAQKARRWVVEAAHSWFNRFRKLRVRYEKLERSFMALNHLAAAIIAFRKIKGSFNIIYG